MAALAMRLGSTPVSAPWRDQPVSLGGSSTRRRAVAFLGHLQTSKLSRGRRLPLGGGTSRGDRPHRAVVVPRGPRVGPLYTDTPRPRLSQAPSGRACCWVGGSLPLSLGPRGKVLVPAGVEAVVPWRVASTHSAALWPWGCLLRTPLRVPSSASCALKGGRDMFTWPRSLTSLSGESSLKAPCGPDFPWRGRSGPTVCVYAASQRGCRCGPSASMRGSGEAAGVDCPCLCHEAAGLSSLVTV